MRRRLILEADFEESRVVALMVLLCMTCIRIVILIYVCMESSVLTFEPCEIYIWLGYVCCEY